jgi:hypothetical protein
MQYEGTIYKEDIDEDNKIKRLFDEVERLEKLVSKRDNYGLPVKLGLQPELLF